MYFHTGDILFCFVFCRDQSFTSNPVFMLNIDVPKWSCKNLNINFNVLFMMAAEEIITVARREKKSKESVNIVYPLPSSEGK